MIIINHTCIWHVWKERRKKTTRPATDNQQMINNPTNFSKWMQIIDRLIDPSAEIVTGIEIGRGAGRGRRPALVNRLIDVITGQSVITDVQDLVRVERNEAGVVVTGHTAADQVRLGPHNLRVMSHPPDGAGTVIKKKERKKERKKKSVATIIHQCALERSPRYLMAVFDQLPPSQKMKRNQTYGKLSM